MSISESFSESDSAVSRAPSQPCSSQNATWLTPARKVRAAGAESTMRPWWLWWNILSLDAPTVAVIWALLFAQACRVTLRVSDLIVLALSVWVIYAVDRLLDSWTARSGGALQERHLFCAAHPATLMFSLISAGILILWMVVRSSAPSEVDAGLKLAGVVGSYLLSVHVTHGFLSRIVPKEIMVGVLFAAGATLPVWSRGRGYTWDLWASLILFASLCALNCLSIECWESHALDGAAKSPRPSFVEWGSEHIDEIAITLALLSLALLVIEHAKWSSRPELPAIFVSAILFLLLNSNRSIYSRQALRVFADAALVLAGLFALTIAR